MICFACADVVAIIAVSEFPLLADISKIDVAVAVQW